MLSNSLGLCLVTLVSDDPQAPSHARLSITRPPTCSPDWTQPGRAASGGEPVHWNGEEGDSVAASQMWSVSKIGMSSFVLVLRNLLSKSLFGCCRICFGSNAFLHAAGESGGVGGRARAREKMLKGFLLRLLLRPLGKELQPKYFVDCLFKSTLC